jgi:hypothetical protein
MAKSATADIGSTKSPISSPWATGRVQRDQGISKSGNLAPDEPRSNSPGCGGGIQQDSFLTQWFSVRPSLD